MVAIAALGRALLGACPAPCRPPSAAAPAASAAYAEVRLRSRQRWGISGGTRPRGHRLHRAKATASEAKYMRENERKILRAQVYVLPVLVGLGASVAAAWAPDSDFATNAQQLLAQVSNNPQAGTIGAVVGAYYSTVFLYGATAQLSASSRAAALHREAAPAGDNGGGQPEPPAQRPGPVWSFGRPMITLVVLYSLMGFFPILIGQYYIAVMWVSVIVVTPFVVPVLLWLVESDD